MTKDKAVSFFKLAGFFLTVAVLLVTMGVAWGNADTRLDSAERSIDGKANKDRVLDLKEQNRIDHSRFDTKLDNILDRLPSL